jgi:phage terminase Nu1 subunit (DNA packaging protein)
MTIDELRDKLQIDRKRLDELVRLGMPARGKGASRTFDSREVADWLVANGYASPPPPRSRMLRTMGQVASHFGVSERAVALWLQQGMPGKPGPRGKQDGYFPIEEISSWLAARKLNGAGSAERERLIKIKRKREELKLGEESGSLLPVETVGRAFLRAIHEARAQLDQLPAAIIKLLPREITGETRDRIRRKIRHSLDHAYGTLADALDRQAAGESVDD